MVCRPAADCYPVLLLQVPQPLLQVIPSLEHTLASVGLFSPHVLAAEMQLDLEDWVGQRPEYLQQADGEAPNGFGVEPLLAPLAGMIDEWAGIAPEAFNFFGGDFPGLVAGEGLPGEEAFVDDEDAQSSEDAAVGEAQPIGNEGQVHAEGADGGAGAMLQVGGPAPADATGQAGPEQEPHVTTTLSNAIYVAAATAAGEGIPAAAGAGDKAEVQQHQSGPFLAVTPQPPFQPAGVALPAVALWPPSQAACVALPPVAALHPC